MHSIWCLLCLTASAVNSEIYHSYFGRLLTCNEYEDFKSRNLINVCGQEIDHCTMGEGRRVDGSCNNLKYETSGMANMPYERLLAFHYGPDSSVSTASDGSPLPLARYVRTQIIPDGIVRSATFNPAAVHFAEFMVLDITFINGFLSMLTEKTHCCAPAGKTDPNCIPIVIPKDDPYLGGSSIRCMNMTRAQSYQDLGCLTAGIPREQINFVTPLIDLSPVYGTNNTQAAHLRSFTKGEMKMVERKGATFPPNTEYIACAANRANESACYDFGSPIGNFDPRLTLLTLWFLRQHNHLASKLSKINPCWNDQKLYDVARQINIAIMQNIYMYEWTPIFLGEKAGLDNKGRIEDYNPSIRPFVLAEFVLGTRMFHTMIDGRLTSYCPNGKLQNSMSFSDQMGRPAVIETDLGGITYGLFWQNASEVDTDVDPDVSETLLSQFQKAEDLYSMDINRARDFGLPPYYQYRDFCGLPRANSFDDFLDVMPRLAVEKLKTVYADFRDVELMVALFLEDFLEDSLAGPTLQCIMIKQNLAWRVGDRFWFEHRNQRASLTNDQIKEIRKMTFSRVACSVADGVTKIQKRSFLLPDPKNPQVSCTNIPDLDLTKWVDDSCDKTCHD